MLTNDLYKKAYLRSIGLISEEAETEQPEEKAVVKQVCFKTSDEALLALLDKGIKEIVIKVEDENGEEVEETFAIDSFGDLEVSEVEEDEDEDDKEEDDEELEECNQQINEGPREDYEEDPEEIIECFNKYSR